MRHFITISLLAVHLLGNTELGQIVRLPKLIMHYYQHKNANPDLSFSSFVTMHYGGDDGNYDDNADDDQLPFHQTQNANFHFTATLHPQVSFKSKIIPTSKDRHFRYNEGNAKEAFLDGLFRPPLVLA